MSSDAPTCTQCDDRVELPFPATVLQLPNDLLAGVQETSKRQKLINEYLQAMNACLNAGDGIVFVHTDKPELLNLFDVQVSSKLQAMVTDDSCFADNFERFFINDKHVVFRVIPRHRSLSTLYPNTKVSLDKGVEEPSQAQLRYLHNITLAPEAVGVEFRDRELILKENQEVMVKRSNAVTHVLQEGCGVEAKQVIIPNSFLNQALVDHCWDNLKLPFYISAFCKLKYGGSIYLGLREEKQNDVKTGKLICDGISLPRVDPASAIPPIPTLDGLMRGLLRKVEKNMLWCPRFPEKQCPVKVEPLPVHNASDRYVVEVKVRRYHGMAFYRKDGPVAYTLSQDSGRLTVAIVARPKWQKVMKKENRATVSD